MSIEFEPSPAGISSNTDAPIHATVAKSAAEEEELTAVKDAVRQLPRQAVKDLLSAGTCARCILRLFGVRGRVYSCHILCVPLIYSLIGGVRDMDEPIEPEGFEATDNLIETGMESGFCSVCLGILQFSYCDRKGELVKNQSPGDVASTIAELVRQEGYQTDNFSLEISIPPIILENELAARLHLKSKYTIEEWMKESTFSELISVKEALKLSLTNLLETSLAILQDGKYNLSDFHIRLTYAHNKFSKAVENIEEKNQSYKRQKQGSENFHYNSSGAKNTDMPTKPEALIKCKLSSSGVQIPSVFPKDQVGEPCLLAVACSRDSIYIGGRYLKFSRNVSQSRWIIDDERMGEASVEEIIGGTILPLCQGDTYKFHAAGREDIDVRMLGSGRPFLVEVLNARHFPSQTALREMETKVNHAGNGLVKVKNLDLVGSKGWNLMHEGEAEKQKQYAALVWLSRPLEDVDIETIVSLKEMQILQKTPVRVLHRRSPMERGRTIHWMKVESIAGSSQYFLLHLCTQAGTYIKEFVHGDLGRTHPSIGSILSCRAEILQLDVTDVKMDCFLN